MGALHVLIALAKPCYLLLGLLIFLIPAERFPSRRSHRRFLLLFYGSALVALLGWSWLAAPFYVSFHPDPAVNTQQQLQFVLENPLRFLRVSVTDYWGNSASYRHMFIGTLGWLDIYLPRRLLELYAGLLLVAALVDGSNSLRLGARSRLLLYLILVAGLTAISLSLYAGWTPVGAATVEGIQGRYFIPLAPVALLALHNRTITTRLRPWHKAAAAIPVLALTWIITIHALLDRYYLP
jgi:uncharacterized membrane protein